jgi:hypothetical protein
VGRPESQLSGDDPRLLAFAADLRRLRRQAGSPSYRKLAKQVHYSPSALSQAANGRSMPSLGVTLGFVRACHGDVAEWERRWRELDAAGAPDGGPEHDPPPATPPEPPGTPPEPPARARRAPPRRLWLGIVSLAAVAACAVVIVELTASPSRPQPGQANPVADGSDPGRAGCGTDAVTMATVRVHFPASQLSGDVELRYSPHCHAAWGRFEPADGWNPGPGTMVTVWTVRPADQATQSYAVEFGGEAIIGNMLMTARGCVQAEVTMTRGSLRSPVAATTCVVIK